MASSGRCLDIMNATCKHVGLGHADNVDAASDHDWTADFAEP